VGDAIQLASWLYLQGQLGEDVPLIAFDDRLTDGPRREDLTAG